MRGVNATGWRCDLGAEYPLLAETCQSICVHSYIVCQIKPKLLQIRLTVLGEEVARQLVSEDAQDNAWLFRSLSPSGESMR